MLVFEGMLVDSAERAGMKIPPAEELDTAPGFDKDKYPHFYVYCLLQLGRSMDWDEPWTNAKVIAGIPEDKLRAMTIEDFMAAGLRYRS